VDPRVEVVSAVLVTRKTCAKCGKAQRREHLVYSRWTRNRYCLDFKACDRRAARRAAQ